MTGQEWVEQIETGHADHRRETPASITEKCRHCQALREAVRDLGRRGGLKGGKTTGASKRRGDSAYYRSLQAKRVRQPEGEHKQDHE